MTKHDSRKIKLVRQHMWNDDYGQKITTKKNRKPFKGADRRKAKRDIAIQLREIKGLQITS